MTLTKIALSIIAGLLFSIIVVSQMSCGGEKLAVPAGVVCDKSIPAKSGACVTDSESDIRTSLSVVAGIPKERADFNVFFTTPGGIRMRSPVEVPDEFKRAADRGVQRTIDKYKAVYPFWKFYTRLVDYDAVLPTANFVGDTNPDIIGAPILTYGGNYTAGTSIGVDPRPSVKKMYLVIPHQAYSDDTHTGAAVRVACDWKWIEFWENTFANEAEHQIERANDYNLFLRFTGWNDVHPHQIP